VSLQQSSSANAKPEPAANHFIVPSSVAVNPDPGAKANPIIVPPVNSADPGPITNTAPELEQEEDELLSITSEDSPTTTQDVFTWASARHKSTKYYACNLHPECKCSFTSQMAFLKHAFLHHRLERTPREAAIITHLVGKCMGVKNPTSQFLAKNLGTSLGTRRVPDLPRLRNAWLEDMMFGNLS